MVASLRSKALTGLIWSAIERFSVQGVQFIVTIILARLVSPEDFGLIGMITVFILLSDIIINGGFSQALIQKNNRTQMDYSTVFYFNLCIAIILYLIIYFSAPYVADFYSQDKLTTVLRVLAISIVIKSLCVVQNAIVSVELNFKLRTKINLISALISGGVAVFLAYHGYGIYALIYQVIIFASLVSMLSFILIRWFPSVAFSFHSLRTLFNFGSKLLIASMVRTVVDNCYAILIGRFLSIRDVGFYTQGRNIPDVLSMNLFNVLQNVFFPLMSSVQNDKERLLRIYIKSIEGTAFIIIPAMVGLIYIADPFVMYFLSDKWAGAIVVIQWIALSRIIIPISALNCSIMNAIGRSDVYLRVDLMKLPLTVGALLITFSYGLQTIVIGNIVVSIICYFINAYYPGKWFGFGAIAQLKRIMPIVGCTLLMAIVLHFVSSQNHLLEIIYKVIIGASVYIIASLIFKIRPCVELIKILSEKVKSRNTRRKKDEKYSDNK